MKRVIATSLLFLLSLAGPAQAEPAEDPLRLFASCAGRLTAQLEHEWLLSDPAARQTEALRTSVLSVLDALMSGAQGQNARAWRVAARAAHRQLLSAGSFGGDDWATDAARRYILRCAELVLVPEPATAPDRS